MAAHQTGSWRNFWMFRDSDKTRFQRQHNSRRPVFHSDYFSCLQFKWKSGIQYGESVKYISVSFERPSLTSWPHSSLGGKDANGNRLCYPRDMVVAIGITPLYLSIQRKQQRAGERCAEFSTSGCTIESVSAWCITKTHICRFWNLVTISLLQPDVLHFPSKCCRHIGCSAYCCIAFAYHSEQAHQVDSWTQETVNRWNSAPIASIQAKI